MDGPKAVLVDDEPNLLASLVRELEQAWPELNILAVAANSREGLECIEYLKPDVVFLDIKMPGMSGLQLVEKISVPTFIVFVTAYDDYAIQAFEASAVDYLLKPVTQARLRITVERLKERINSNTGQDLEVLKCILAKIHPSEENHLQWIRAGQGDSVQLIPVDSINFFQSGHKYTSVFTDDGEYVIRTTIMDLVRRLDPQAFWQIHRGTIISAKCVVRAVKDFRGRYSVQLCGRKERLKVSQSYAYHFRQM